MNKYRRIIHQISFLGALLCFISLISGCMAPTWITDATNIIPQLIISAGSILSLISILTGNPADAALFNQISAWGNKLLAGFKNVEELISEYNANPNDTLLQKIEDVANLVVSDIKTFDDIIGVPPALSTKLQALAQIVLQQFEAWITLLPLMKTAARAAGTQITITPPLDKKTFKQQFNDVLLAPTGDPDVDAKLATVKKL